MEPGALKQKHSTEKDFSAQRKNFLYLPKNDKLFKRKKISHPPKRADFPSRKFFYIYAKLTKGKKNPLFSQENKFSKLKTYF